MSLRRDAYHRSIPTLPADRGRLPIRRGEPRQLPAVGQHNGPPFQPRSLGDGSRLPLTNGHPPEVAPVRVATIGGEDDLTPIGRPRHLLELARARREQSRLGCCAPHVSPDRVEMEPPIHLRREDQLVIRRPVESVLPGDQRHGVGRLDPAAPDFPRGLPPLLPTNLLNHDRPRLCARPVPRTPRRFPGGLTQKGQPAPVRRPSRQAVPVDRGLEILDSPSDGVVDSDQAVSPPLTDKGQSLPSWGPLRGLDLPPRQKERGLRLVPACSPVDRDLPQPEHSIPLVDHLSAHW